MNDQSSCSVAVREADVPLNYQKSEPLALHSDNDRATRSGTEAAVLDVHTFALLAGTMSWLQCGDFVSRSLLTIDIQLIEIASRRSANDFTGVEFLAHQVALLAEKIGAVRVTSIARRLEQSCKGDVDDTYRLISELASALDVVRDSIFNFILSDNGMHSSTNGEGCDAICSNP